LQFPVAVDGAVAINQKPMLSKGRPSRPLSFIRRDAMQALRMTQLVS